MIWLLIIIVAIVAAACFVPELEECPRALMGYRCQGERCDHSVKELEDVKRALRAK